MKKILIPLVIILLLLLGGLAYLYKSLDEQKKVNQDMQELAELDKKEMQNEYEEFARQYSEMKTQINNDSIVAQLTKEQMRTQELLKELREVKANDAREITRLKKELATCRAIIRSYVLEIDSLNRLNQNLTAENTRVKGQYEEATRQIQGLSAEKSSLSEKVAIAAQLDATGISMRLLNKKNKSSTTYWTILSGMPNSTAFVAESAKDILFRPNEQSSGGSERMQIKAKSRPVA